MATSPTCVVKDGSGSYVPTVDGVNATPTNTISIQLSDPSQVSSWALEVIGTDELTAAPTLTGVDSGTHLATNPTTTVTFTMPAGTGKALLFRSAVIGGTGSFTTTFGIYSLTTQGNRVGAFGEQREGDHTYGWVTKVNPLIRAGVPVSPGNATSIQGTPVNATAPSTVGMAILFDGSQYLPTVLTQDLIQPAFAVTMSGAQSLQVGATSTQPAFTASYVSGPTTSVFLTDSAGTPSKDVSSTPTSFASNATFVRTAINASVTFTTTAHKSSITRTSAVTFTWEPLVFFAATTVPGAYNEAFIESLASSVLAPNYLRTFTVTAGASDKIYYAFPTAYGTPTFYVGGFAGGFVLAATAVNVTNSFGVTIPYDLYESSNLNLGTTTVQVV